MKPIPLLFLSLALILLLTACTPAAPQQTVTVGPTLTAEPVQTKAGPSPETPPSALSSFTKGTFFGLTHQRENGSRLLAGKGSLPEGEPVRVALPGEVRWITAVPYQTGSLWTAVLEDGSVETYHLTDGEARALGLGWGPLPPGTPPLVVNHEGELRFYGPPAEDAAPLSHPLVLNPEQERLVYLTESGDLVLRENGQEVDRLAADALPDARLTADSRGRLLFLSGPTERYAHGALGDDLEAGAVSLVETDPDLQLIHRIEISPPGVVEGTAPLWADLNGDGVREILVTVSTPENGARLVVFSESGEVLAQGPAPGQGFRWRHQLAAAPLGPEGEMLIVDVLRPHLDAVLEFFAWEGDRLARLAALPGYSSHRIGSRNLDMARVGDLDGDGVLEVVVPDRSQTSFNGISYQDGEAVLDWTFELDGELTSNLAGVSLRDGRLVFAAAAGEILYLWP